MSTIMPDVTSGKSLDGGKIKWVGMEKIQCAVLLKGSLNAAFADFGVSLIDVHARGIHMSRLYRICNEIANEEFNTKHLKALCKKALDSHKTLSDLLSLNLRFHYLTKRKSLKSDNEAFRSYPVSLGVTLNDAGVFEMKLSVDVLYSSACPCSETLARQAIVENFEKHFAERAFDKASVKNWLEHENGIYPIPHSQRSIAHVEVMLAKDFGSEEIEALIVFIEKTLKTGVQAVVKREDEQAFAVINGEHLMFCEDAARKLSKALSTQTAYTDFSIKMTHEESLHPHDAVSYTEKNF